MFTKNDEMGQAATGYFKHIFFVDPSLDATPIIHLVDPIINNETNEMLCAEFTEKEISDALFQICPLRHRAPMGFPLVSFSVTGGP